MFESEAGDVRSFELLKEERLSKQSVEMKSMNLENRTSIKIEISSKFV
jgi:hypothetical protein